MYVELRSDPRDSRARLLELTARGHALVEAMFNAERELESVLTPGQRSELKKTPTAPVAARRLRRITRCRRSPGA